MDDFAQKVILVTGGTGSIGSEIVRQLLLSDAAQIRVFSRDEFKQHELRRALGGDTRLRFLIGDVRDKDRLNFALRGVDICFHAAALKHVPICEYNPFEAVKTNIVGTQNVIEAAITHNLQKVVAVSSDKAVSPGSVLGASKLMMERLIIAANLTTGSMRTRFSCVRFGNVLYSRGSVMDLWRAQIAEGGPLTVTHPEATRYFMEIPQAVSLIFSASTLMQGGELFVLKMPKRPIIEFAQEAIVRHGDGSEIAIEFIGLRPGEKLHEKLLTEEEESHTLERDDMYIILPENISERAAGEEARTYDGARPYQQ